MAKKDQAQACLRLIDAIEEWCTDNKDEICYEKIIWLCDTYRDYYKEDGVFWQAVKG